MRINASIIMLLAAIGAAGSSPAEQHPLGLIWKDPRVAAPGHGIKVVPGKGPLPSSLDHSAGMPPVGDQGGQGSCTAWATAYYHKSYQEGIEHGWSMTDQNHQFSPSFVYNQINGGADYGSSFEDAFQLLCDMGSSSLYLKPYYDGDCISWPSETAYDSAISYRSEEWYWFDLSDSVGIEGVKQCLNNGDNVAIGLLVYPNYDNISTYDNKFCVADLYGDIRGGHANCIVGYDDSLMTNDGPGAFRVVNSWGGSWGDGGYYWMSYKAATDHLTSYQTAYYSSDRIAYQPRLKMHAKIAHPNRGSVKLQVGVGPFLSPYWQRLFYFNPSYGYYFGGGNNPFPDNNIVLDLTEGVSCLDSLSGNNLFLRCQDDQTDGLSGTVEFLGAESVDWGVSNNSLETPVAIADDFDYHYTNVSLHYHDFRVEADPLTVVSNQGDTACLKVVLRQVNGFNRQVYLHSRVTPPPGTGSIGVSFDRVQMVPDDSCIVRLTPSPDVTPGKYQVALLGIDSLDTLTRQADVAVWVLGSGQAICIGSTSGMLGLVRSRWSSVDSLPAMPPAIGSNCRLMVLENGLTTVDSAQVSGFIAGGGQVLSVGRSAYDLCGGLSLLPISQWLGASNYAWYTGSGISLISDYQNPFGVATIDWGDTLGTLSAGSGRLSNRLPGAVSLAHLGTVTSAIAALYNVYGAGQSLWTSAGAGFSEQMDSLIAGFLSGPLSGVCDYEGSDRQLADMKPSLSAFPAPFDRRSTIALNLPAGSRISLRIYDICGRMVRTLFQGQKSAGSHLFIWDGRDGSGKRTAAGIYFIQAETDHGKMLEKIVSIR